jgi:hypothetical protein
MKRHTPESLQAYAAAAEDKLDRLVRNAHETEHWTSYMIGAVAMAYLPLVLEIALKGESDV